MAKVKIISTPAVPAFEFLEAENWVSLWNGNRYSDDDAKPEGNILAPGTILKVIV